MLFCKNKKYRKLARLLSLDKPLVIFDTETTGLNLSQDKIIQIACIKIWQEGKVAKSEWTLNPEMGIAPEATAVHGFIDKDLALMPKFREKAQEIWDVFNGCYYGGFNIVGFDLPILRREFIRVGMDFNYNIKDIIDSREIFKYMVPRSLASAYEYYCHKALTQTHQAPDDTEAVIETLMRQIEKHEELRDWNFINRIHEAVGEEYIDSTRKFYWRGGEAVFSFSKYRGQTLSRVAHDDPDFLKWILAADFSDETKSIVEKALDKNNGKKQ